MTSQKEQPASEESRFSGLPDADIYENEILQASPELLATLLRDHTITLIHRIKNKVWKII